MYCPIIPERASQLKLTDHNVLIDALKQP